MNSFNAYKFIAEICTQSFMQPKVVEQKMRNNLNLTVKYQRKLWTRTILGRLTRKCIGTNEVQNYSFNHVKSMIRGNLQNELKQIVTENMIHKLENARTNEIIAKEDMVQSSIELNKIVNNSTLVYIEYKNIVDYEWNVEWIYQQTRCNKKLKWLEQN